MQAYRTQPLQLISHFHEMKLLLQPLNETEMEINFEISPFDFKSDCQQM